jgi:uncharacterized repeat protein (TIGR01451 family)
LNVLAGTYSVTEGALPANFDLTSLQCVETGGDGGSTPSTPTLTATGSIDLDAGETVTCTYTNTKRGTIVIVKDTVPAGHEQNFSYTSTIDATGATCTVDASPAAFVLDDDGSGSPPSDTETCTNVLPGSYSVTESLPTGWAIQSLICVETDGDGGSTPNPASATLVASIDLDPGETVTCTYTNKALPDLAVEKDGVIRYTIKVTNNGPGAADTWSVSDPLPGDLTWSVESQTNATPTCSVASNTLTCSSNGLSLASGGTFSVTVKADIAASSCTGTPKLSNTATATATGDYVSANNSDTTVICP